MPLGHFKPNRQMTLRDAPFRVFPPITRPQQRASLFKLAPLRLAGFFSLQAREAKDLTEPAKPGRPTRSPSRVNQSVR